MSAADTPGFFVSEVHPAGSGNGTYNADWFEVTNAGTTAVDLTGWRVDDSSNAIATAVPLSGVTSIAPGQSVVFLENTNPVDIGAFTAAWFGASVPAGLTIGTYGGSGVGLSTGGDAVNLFDAAGNRVTGISFGGANAAATFDNAAGVGSDTPPSPVVSTTSVAGVNGAILSANGAETGSPGRRANPSSPSTLDLSVYVRVGRFDLPEPTRTTPPANSVLAQEVSAVTYNWDTDTLFVVGDGGTSIVQVTKTGALIDSMTLATGGSPQGTEFYDPEGLTYIGGGVFVMVEERDRQAVRFTYAAGTTLLRSQTQTVKLGTFVDNIGIEGVTYDPLTGGFIAVKEIDPQGLFLTGIDFAAGTATNGSPTTANSVNLFDFVQPFAGLLDFADVYALSNLSTSGPDAANLLVLSQESARILNIDRSGTVLSSLTILSDPGNPLSVSAQQHEGLTMDRDGVLYVVSENGGGDFDHPQLWVYAPSAVPNQVPTSLTLASQVTTIEENSSTAARIKVADVVITDDGLGTNNLTVAGADADAFEADLTGLYIKAGATLDFETQSSYSVTVAVDDTTVGTTPDATADFTLTLIDVSPEAPSSTLVITEVAPWGSGESPYGADWFEVMNTGASPVNVTGWRMDDSSNAFGSAVALTGVASIAPGESVIFMETGNLASTAASFLSTWFGAAPPAGLQIGAYAGGGVGLSTGGDAVNLFDGAGTLQASVSFGASPAAAPFGSFDNPARLNAVTLTQFSVAGVNGAFVAANDVNEIGSPGAVAPIGRLLVTEVAPWSSGNSPVGADWFEVTNVGASAVDIAGWRVDDNSESFAAAVALTGITSIGPGESVIFLETGNLASTAAAFRSTWFGASPPPALQIGAYSGGGVGLSTGGDAVNLYDANGVLQAKVFFGASSSGPSFPSFDNAAGLNNAAITVLSAAGVNGAFRAPDGVEVGSPGTTRPDTTPPVVAPLANIATSTTDPSGVALAFSASATDNVSGPANLEVVCEPASGTLFPIGTTTVGCTARDEAGNTSAPVTFTITVTLIVPNHPPIAAPDAASTLEGAPVAVPVLANDTDSDGDTLTLASVGTPAHGSAAIAAGGVLYTPAAGFHGTDTFTYVVSDGRGESATGTVTVRVSRLGRFVALSRDMTWMRAGSKALTGDVGAIERRVSNHRRDREPDDDNRDDVTVRIGVGAAMQQPMSRVVGDTVLLLNRSSVYDVIDNVLLARRNSTILGSVSSPMTPPFVALPAFPAVQPGVLKISVPKNRAATLAPGAYGAVSVAAGGTLVLSGGLYQVESIELAASATLLFRGATELRVRSELTSRAKAKLIVDPSVPGLTASQVVIYVAGLDEECRRVDADDDGDDAGPVVVHIGTQNVVQANIVAARGTVWLKSKTRATGAFIGMHVRIGVNAELTLDSAF